MKKVLLVVIDALSSRFVPRAIDAGQLPTLRALRDVGVLREKCTSVFPSITPAATASIVTGRYPNEHGIAGNFWYDREHDSVAYYGDDLGVVMNAGFGKFFDDYLLRLNFQRLRADTLYEIVERRGRTAASINYMWFRGEKDHSVNVPLLLQLLPGVKSASRVRGPTVLALADFAQSTFPGSTEKLSATGGLLKRHGFHDDSTAEYLKQLASADPFPDFCLAYFPNNDFEGHKVGSEAALPVVQQVDSHLAEFFDKRGGLDRFLEESAVIVVGDHAQSDVLRDTNRQAIDLSLLLCDYQLCNAGANWSEGDQLMVCPNMRSAQIYVRNEAEGLASLVATQLVSDERIDQVLWADQDNGRRVMCVATRDRGTLRFWRSSDLSAVVDSYGGRWSHEGQLDAIAASVTDGKLGYGDYPNAMERIAGGFAEVSGDFWVTASLGHEFCVPETHLSKAGSHGTLHADDSESVLLVAGADAAEVPQQPRIIDVAPLCLRLLGLE